LLVGYLKVFKHKEAAEEHVRKVIAQVDVDASGKIDYTGLKDFELLIL
jgi:Ca2+-binding EF-hand superfamily protein